MTHPSPSTPRGSMPSAEASGFLPDAITVGARHVQVGGEWVASFAVTGYPREVHPGWLEALLSYPGRLDVSLHIEPTDPAIAARRLRRQLAKLESTQRSTADQGQLPDPHADAATGDAHELSARLARGEGRLFRIGLYLTVHAPTQQALENEVAAVRAITASLLLDAQPATYRSLQGWITCLPMGLDLLGMRRSFDTDALAAAFPFASADLPSPDPTGASGPTGVLYGINLGSNSLVHWDRFALGPTVTNHTSVVLGRSGAGKSYFVKLEALRSLYRGIEVAVVDCEDEYARLAESVGGTLIRLGAEGIRLNPFDLPIHIRADGRRTADRDALTRRALFLHTVLAALLGEQIPAEWRTVVDEAITTTYQQAGITHDPRTWTRTPPLLPDLARVLAGMNHPIATELGGRLRPFTDGAYSGLFTGPTTIRPEGHLIVFSLRELPEEVRPLGILLTLDVLWRRVSTPGIRRPRLVVVDEAWQLLRQHSGADFLYRMAKASRRHWAGLTVSTQDTADLLGSDLGQAVVANAATSVLMRQAPQAIDEVTHAFDLSDAERDFLLGADRGQGLLASGGQHVAFQTLASPTEDALATTSPEFLATLQDSAADSGQVDLDPPDAGFDGSGEQVDLDTP